jgi:protein arginine kinase
LGLGMGTIDLLPLPLINEILILSQPAHLQKYFNQDMDEDERDIMRAELVRSKLANCN